jgi:hypothetical protein
MMRKGFFTSAVVLCAAVFAYVALAVSVQALAQAPAPRAAVQTMKPAPPGPLPPMPLNGPLARPREIVAAVYEFVARHPEVAQYMPCYCGCEQLGHRGNHDCFVKSRDASGRVQWNDHGTHCTVCIDVARDAMMMFNSGVAVPQIRAAIDQKWGSRAITQTPTPAPPAARPRS